MLRDYMNAFIGKDLVTGSHLSYFTNREGSLAQQLERLEKLHYTLEVVVLLEQYLKLPHAAISSAARTVLKYYEVNSPEEQDKFNLPVQTTSVMQFIERVNANQWQSTCSSIADGNEV